MTQVELGESARELAREVLIHGPISRSELGRRLGLSPASLTRLSKPFLDRGLFVAAPGVPMAALEALPFEFGGHWLLAGWGDAEFVTLTPGLGRYFGTEKGVLVARAPRDAALGLQDGDVIPSDRVETNVELNRILAELFPLLRTVRPADLNATLNALATALGGRGEDLGATLDRLDGYLDAIDDHLPTLRELIEPAPRLID